MNNVINEIFSFNDVFFYEEENREVHVTGDNAFHEEVVLTIADSFNNDDALKLGNALSAMLNFGTMVPRG